ncbi:MAG: ECF-type sigma factor [Acidobacteriota bacterium]
MAPSAPVGDQSAQPATERDITALLLAWRDGEEDALVELMPRVYRELREIAHHLLRREWSGKSLETCALVHEAYLRLVDLERIGWQGRRHFFAMSARVMRRVLVDQARYRSRDKRGGDARRVDTSVLRGLAEERAPEVLAVDEALHELARHDAELAQIVELRFFGGLGREEISEVVGLSSATVTRRWFAARAWLIGYLADHEADVQ